MNINQAIFYFLYNLPRQSPTGYAWVIFLADSLPYLVILFAMFYLLFRNDHSLLKVVSWIRKTRDIIVVFGLASFAWGVSKFLKMAVNASRPFDTLPDVSSLFSATGQAFPSGHATFFMALAMGMYFVNKKAGYVFMIFAFLIGIARIIAGVHFPFDILGGFVLGAGLVFFIRKHKYFERSFEEAKTTIKNI